MYFSEYFFGALRATELNGDTIFPLFGALLIVFVLALFILSQHDGHDLNLGGLVKTAKLDAAPKKISGSTPYPIDTVGHGFAHEVREDSRADTHPVVRELYKEWLKAKVEIENDDLWMPVSKDEFFDSNCVLKEHRKLKNVFFSVIDIECSRDDAVANFDKKYWNKNIKTIHVLEEYLGPERPCRATYMLYERIGPLSPRDVIVKECIFDIGDGKIVHVAKSVDHSDDPKLGSVRVDVERVVHIFESAGPKHCKISKVEKSNIHAPFFIPNASLRIGMMKRPIKDFKYLARYATTNDEGKEAKLLEPLTPSLDTKRNVSSNPRAEDVTLIEEEELAEGYESSFYIGVGVTAALALAYSLRRRW
jgi:hypothetical protein